jgi:hypothetical protein
MTIWSSLKWYVIFAYKVAYLELNEIFSQPISEREFIRVSCKNLFLVFNAFAIKQFANNSPGFDVQFRPFLEEV